MIEEDLDKVGEGDTIVLRDFHTLEFNNGGDLTATVTEVARWDAGNYTAYGFIIEISDDIILMIYSRVINDTIDFKVYRQWDSCSLAEFDDQIIEEGDFVPFSIDHEGDVSYSMKSPFPFWGVSKDDGSSVGICEWIADDEDADETFWAKNALAEWYHSSEDEEGDEDGLVTLWFGWEIGANDVEVAVV
jgi:hypothetical protein